VTPPPDYIPKGEQLLYQIDDARTRVRAFISHAGCAP
jgi:hypothetical protein